ncbi:3-oxoacyl-[acyl-carrier-protein] reductase FabG-like [Episyrphus balteatus]|uniref:3-oxoacyl-[acyl-carrier-protein] reductase FabG-like n=1 Tax=Episyrphus balteatus TaxID=286459 RepID=UPI002486AD85|nr:3-oxoacyl-[acyl-carrier-protein] reductase FabG-like [Episyrphus balteatus]
MSLNGKVAIITGASSGIGAETCKHFAKAGAHVVAVGRNLENLKLTAETCAKTNSSVKCLLVQADITKDTQKIVNETLAEFGKIDVLVNNAGIMANGSILEADLQQLDSVLDTNLRSVFQLTKLVLPHLIKTKGNVVNVSSVAGMRSFPNILSYCISKAALDQFTKCVALEMAPHNVRVNSVNPAMIVSDIYKRIGVNDEDYAKILERSATTHAMGRVGEVHEVAPAIVFLASDSASFITGALFPIDGGKSSMCPR